MSNRSPARKPAAGKPAYERRAPRGKPGSLSWLKGLMGRPVTLARRDGSLHITLLDRRRSPAEIEAQALQALRQELQTRLLAHDVDQAARVMRHLVFVHDELGRSGWSGVADMPSSVLGKALVQVEMLHGQDKSRLLAKMAERLRLLKTAAEVREESRPRREVDRVADVEVIETAYQDFEETERSWVGTLPPTLARREPEG